MQLSQRFDSPALRRLLLNSAANLSRSPSATKHTFNLSTVIHNKLCCQQLPHPTKSEMRHRTSSIDCDLLSRLVSPRLLVSTVLGQRPTGFYCPPADLLITSSLLPQSQSSYDDTLSRYHRLLRDIVQLNLLTVLMKIIRYHRTTGLSTRSSSSDTINYKTSQ